MRPKSTAPLDYAKAYEVIWDQVVEIFEAVSSAQNPAFVYLIGEEDGGAVKIGTAVDPIKRLRTMQTGNPRRLRVEWVLAGDRDLERMLHRLWKPLAITSGQHRAMQRRWPDSQRTAGTEWFQPEVRKELFPIIRTAVALQLEHLKAAKGDVFLEDVAALVVKAHQEHDFTFSHQEYKDFVDSRVLVP